MNRMVKVRLEKKGEDVWDITLAYGRQIHRVGRYQGRDRAIEASRKKAAEVADVLPANPAMLDEHDRRREKSIEENAKTAFPQIYCVATVQLGTPLWRLGSNRRKAFMAIQDSVSEIVYPWQNEYTAALLEFDGQALKDRIKAAEDAIERRLQQLSQDSNHHTERRVIHDAGKRPRDPNQLAKWIVDR